MNLHNSHAENIVVTVPDEHETYGIDVHIEDLNMLVFKGINLEVGTANVPNFKIKQTLLCRAGAWGDTKLIEFIIDKGADVNCDDEKGVTALIYAAEKGQIDAVKMLLAKGARAAANFNQNSALKTAERNGHEEIAALLKQHNA